MLISVAKFDVLQANSGLTNRALMKKARTSSNTLAKIRNGKPVQAIVVSRIAKAFNVNANELVKGV